MSLDKKFVIHCEPAYVFACVILSFAVAMATSADFGLSMVVCPAYIISQKSADLFGFALTFGQSEYLLQALLFIALCILIKSFKVSYLFSFFTCLFYGALLDMWRIIIPHFNPAVTAPGSLPMPTRIVYFVISIILTDISIAIYYYIYLPSQVYDFFVKAVASHFNKNQTKYKIIFDFSSLGISVALSLLFFGKFVGVGVGTLVITAVNGTLIGIFGKLMDKSIEYKPLFPKFAKHFETT